MWGNDKNFKAEKVDTLVGEGTEILGDINFTGGLHVDGTIKGNVVAKSESATVLVLSETGTIEGEVRVPYVVIDGVVCGDIHVHECVELAAHARISGNVYYKKIEMAMGAEVNGGLVHIDEATQTPVVKQLESTVSPIAANKLD